VVGVGLCARAAVVVAGAAAVAGDLVPPQRAVADVAVAALQDAAVRLGRRRPELPLRVIDVVAVRLAAALADGADALPAAREEAVELHVVVGASDGRRGGGDGQREDEDQDEALHAGHSAAAAAVERGKGRGNECAWGSVQRGLSCPGVTRGGAGGGEREKRDK